MTEDEVDADLLFEGDSGLDLIKKIRDEIATRQGQ
jgi:hypothetical protein